MTTTQTNTELRFTFYTDGKPGLEYRATSLPVMIHKLHLVPVFGPWAETTAAGETEAMDVTDPQGNTYTVRW